MAVKKTYTAAQRAKAREKVKNMGALKYKKEIKQALDMEPKKPAVKKKAIKKKKK